MSDKTLAQRLESHAQMHDELAASTGDTEQSGFAADLREAIAMLANRDGWFEQHSRDSAELRRLCAARDAYKAERDALLADATAPAPTPAPAWEPLTDERIAHLKAAHVGDPSGKYPLTDKDWTNFARAIEADILRCIGAQKGGAL